MCCVEDPERNLRHALDLIEKAAKKGAQVICLPELFKSQYFCQTNNKKHFNLAEPVPGPTCESLSSVAKKLGVVIVGSVFEKDSGKNYFNTAIVINSDGNLLGKYRKTHIPDDPDNYYSEKFYFKPGNLGYQSFKTSFAQVGTLICWDQWYPEAARATALEGAQIIFYPTAIGWQLNEKETETGRGEYDAWVTIQRSHAIANGVFVASVNRTGLEDKINFWGGSFVCDPFGKIIFQASNDKEEILVTSLDLNRIDEVRKDWPFLS